LLEQFNQMGKSWRVSGHSSHESII
jgi:hypothetical protein